MKQPHKQIVLMEFDVDEPWLQITRLSRQEGEEEFKQKVIRLSPEDQERLYLMIKERRNGEMNGERGR